MPTEEEFAALQQRVLQVEGALQEVITSCAVLFEIAEKNKQSIDGLSETMAKHFESQTARIEAGDK